MINTILICLTSCFVLFCLPSVRSLLSIYHSLSIYLFVCLPVLSNLHFGIDFGRNDPGPKRPRAESTHLPRPKRPTPKLGRNDPGRNDPGRNDPGPKRPGFDTFTAKEVKEAIFKLNNKKGAFVYRNGLNYRNGLPELTFYVAFSVFNAFYMHGMAYRSHRE